MRMYVKKINGQGLEGYHYIASQLEDEGNDRIAMWTASEQVKTATRKNNQ